MGHRLNNLEALARIRQDIPDTTVINKVSPFFVPGAVRHPERMVEHETMTQLFWEQQGPGRFEHELLCLTLGTESLTIALRHRHDASTGPVAVETHPFTTASIHIDHHSHRLMVANPVGRDYQLYDQAAAAEFLPRLDHTLGVLNLGHHAAQAAHRRWAS